MPRFREDHAVEIPRLAVSMRVRIDDTSASLIGVVCRVCCVVVVVMCVCFGEGKEEGG